MVPLSMKLVVGSQASTKSFEEFPVHRPAKEKKWGFARHCGTALPPPGGRGGPSWWVAPPPPLPLPPPPPHTALSYAALLYDLAAVYRRRFFVAVADSDRLGGRGVWLNIAPP